MLESVTISSLEITVGMFRIRINCLIQPSLGCHSTLCHIVTHIHVAWEQSVPVFNCALLLQAAGHRHGSRAKVFFWCVVGRSVSPVEKNSVSPTGRARSISWGSGNMSPGAKHRESNDRSQVPTRVPIWRVSRFNVYGLRVQTMAAPTVRIF